MLITELKEAVMKLAIIKISGKSLQDFTWSENGINLLKNIQKQYKNVILIHGGGKIISEWSLKLGIQPSFHEGQRIIVCREPSSPFAETKYSVTKVFRGEVQRTSGEIWLV